MTSEAEGATPLWVAIALCAGGVALFSVMDVAMKISSLAIGAYTTLLWRSLAATLIAGTGMIATRNRRPPAAVMRLHLLRGSTIGVMAWLFFWALTRLPLAEAIALSFVAPVIALALSAVMLGENISRHSIVAGILGLGGVGVILSGRMTGTYDGRAVAGAVATLVSAILFAVTLVLQRRQAQVAGPIEVTFFQNFIILLMFLPLAPWLLDAEAGAYWPEIVGSAFLACGSQLLLAAAYARAPANRLIPLEYSAFIWAALFGWLVFDDKLTVEVLVGVVLIVTACIVTAREKPRIAARVEADLA